MAHLTKSLIDDVVTYLAGSSVGLLAGSTPTANLFTFTLPVSPANAVAVIPLGGPRLHGDYNAMKRTQFQVLVRNESVTAALSLAEAIFSLLDNRQNVLSAHNLGRIWADHEPGPYWRDGNSRVTTSLNFHVECIRR